MTDHDFNTSYTGRQFADRAASISRDLRALADKIDQKSTVGDRQDYIRAATAILHDLTNALPNLGLGTLLTRAHDAQNAADDAKAARVRP